jgi:hypothetical protein
MWNRRTFALPEDKGKQGRREGAERRVCMCMCVGRGGVKGEIRVLLLYSIHLFEAQRATV